MEKIKQYKDLFLPVAIVLAALIVGGSILMGKVDFSLPKSSSSSRATSPTPSQPSPSPSGGSVDIPVSSDDHIRGNPQAPVTLIEFSDMQCPFCQRFHPTAKQALQEYGDQLRWVYKHFPLDSIHPHATPAAEASECVWEQKGDDGFWTFVDGVFDNQDRMGPELYRELAQNMGANMSRFDDCVSQRKYQEKVRADYDLGTKSGVTGTPGNFINGTPVQGAVPYEELKRVIDSKL